MMIEVTALLAKKPLISDSLVLLFTICNTDYFRKKPTRRWLTDCSLEDGQLDGFESFSHHTLAG